MNTTRRKFWPVLGRSLYVTAIYLGLPLLGWGVDNLPAFFTHPARAAFAGLVAAQALFSAWLVARMPPPTGERPHHDLLARWHSYLFESIAVLAAYGDRRNVLAWAENGALRWVGLGLYLAGVALAAWASFTWVEHLRTGAPSTGEPAMLTDGPFRHVRHPAYAALFLYCTGFTLLLRSWVGAVLIAALAAAIVHRVRGEEQDFARQFKSAWTERCRASWRLIPLLY